MGKKIIIVGFILVMFLCTACTRKETDTIKFATWGSQSEIEILKPIIADYNKNHETKVEMIHIPQNYFQKLHLLFASNLSPDVIFINNLYLPVYQKADLFEDLTPYIDKDDYFKNALATMSIENKIYAVPRDVSSMVVFYNKDFFKKNNLVAKSDWNINDFLNIANAGKKKAEYSFCTELSMIYWENFVSIANKPIFLNGKKTINEKASIKELQRIADLINIERACPKLEQLKMTPCLQMFLNKQTPIIISGRWIVPKLENTATFEYGVLPFPKGKSEYYIPLNASGWAVYKNSQHKEESINFVKFLSSDENIEKMAKSGLIIPAKKKIAKSGIVKNGQVFVDVIEKSTPNIVSSDYKVETDKLELKANSIFGGYKKAEDLFSE